MRCTCDNARREARAEAFEEAALYCGKLGYTVGARHFVALAAEARAARVVEAPVLYTELPPNDDITDCTDISVSPLTGDIVLPGSLGFPDDSTYVRTRRP
jgi:hypothetical protein